MDDHRRMQILEQYEDAALTLLMDESAEAEGERLLNAFAQAQAQGQIPTLPPEYDEKCQTLIDRTFKRQAVKEKWTRFGKKSLRVAAVTIAILGIMVTAVLKVEAIRVPVLNYLYKHCDRFSIMIYPDTVIDSIMPLMDPFELLSSSIPEGYSLFQDQSSGESDRLVAYINDKEEIIVLSFFPSSGAVMIDTENCIITEMNINGQEATLLEKTNLHHFTLYWIDVEQHRTYYLSSSALTKEEFIEMAFGVIQ